MSQNRQYVFFGCWIEYSLHPLFEYMRDQGFDCIEITPDTCADMKKALYDIRKKESVFITSAHVFLDETHPPYKGSPVNLSALEAIDILKPIKKVHYPHDLATLVHEMDAPWLDSVFETLLMPMDGFAHMARNGRRVCNVGWIKKHKITGSGEKYTVGHAVSEWGNYKDNVGLDKIYDIFHEVWTQGVIVKSGVLNEVEQDREFLRNNNVNFIDASHSIFDLIDTCEIMLTNALTSVNLESALSGRFTINMLDGIFGREEHEKYFNGLPNFQMMTIDETAGLLREYYRGEFIPTQGKDILKAFDFAQAVKLITV